MWKGYPLKVSFLEVTREQMTKRRPRCRPVSQRRGHMLKLAWGAPGDTPEAAGGTFWWNDVMTLYLRLKWRANGRLNWCYLEVLHESTFFDNAWAVCVCMCVWLCLWHTRFYFPLAQPLAEWVAHLCVQQRDERHFDLNYFEVSSFDWRYFQKIKCRLFFDQGLVSDFFWLSFKHLSAVWSQ